MGLKYLSLLIFSLFLFISAAYAAPGIPHQFYGTVTVDGAPADNASIVAKINTVEVANTVSVSGTYGYFPNIFYIEDPDGSGCIDGICDGRTIEFYLNGNMVAEATFEN